MGSKIPAHRIHHISNNISKIILRNARATKTQKALAIKVFKNVQKKIKNMKKLSPQGRKAIRKIHKAIPAGHLNTRKAKKIAHRILTNTQNHKAAKLLAKHFLIKVLRNKHSTGSAMVMANRVFQIVKRHIRNSKRGPQQSHPRPVHSRHHRRAHKSVNSIAHRIVSKAKNPHHARRIARRLVLNVLKNPKSSKKTKILARKNCKKKSSCCQSFKT